MAVPNVYFDNNETIYCEIYGYDSTTSTDINLTFGLSDLAELPGQSTWFINKIQFMVAGYTDLTSPGTSDTVGRFNAGIIPRDQAGGNFNTIDDYQDYRAWPLKGTIGHTFHQGDSNPAHNRFSASRTYTPRKALVLNREQNIMWTWSKISGPTNVCLLGIVLQGKRGD